MSSSKSDSTAPPIIFVVMQTENQANGGVESITLVIERLKRFRPIVITQLETPIVERWRRAGAEVHIWPLPYKTNISFSESPFLQKWKRFFSLLQTNLKMARLVRSMRGSVIHCNDMVGFLHYALGAKLAGEVIVFNIRGTNSEERYNWRWHWAYRLSDAVVVLSQEMGQQFTKKLGIGKSKDKFHFIYSVIDLSDIESTLEINRLKTRCQLKIPGDQIAIGYVGVFRPLKAQLAFIEQVLPTLKRIYPECHVYFLGDFEPEHNAYARRCAEAVRMLNLSDFVSFVGYVDNIYEWYQALDLTIVASVREGLARSMIESLACGTPVVSFDVCSAREILEGYRCGFVVPKGEYSALLEQIRYLIEHPELRQAFGEAGARAAVELFDPVYVVQKYEDLYLSLSKVRDEL